MNCQATRVDIERFSAVISRKIGLQFGDTKLGFLGEVLQRRLDALGRSSHAYLWSLEHKSSDEEIGALACALTVGETYFFRNVEQFRALAEVVLPERMSARRTSGALRLLSAGCASGEEAYSMAITARESIADPSWDVAIRAIDLNPAALEKAARARYSSWSLRDTPMAVQRKWFRRDDREFALDETLRGAVMLEPGNVASDDLGLWQPGAYDAVFCRNVLMYFSPEQMRAAIARIARALAPGGFLFLGHAETLRGVSDRFHLRHSHGTFYYELKDGAETACAQAPQLAPIPLPVVPFPAPADDSWVDTIRIATERVAKLVPHTVLDGSATCTPALSWDRAPALDLLRKERFAEALDHVRARPPGHRPDPDVLLLEATLLVHSGQPVAAEDACLRLLLVDELNAGAHYVLALCREHSGHPARAVEHDRVSSYLDPAFAMPRLHLGMMADRAGDRPTARRELKQALDLLQREDASRLLLFGGGFGREALMAFCESALQKNGAKL